MSKLFARKKNVQKQPEKQYVLWSFFQNSTKNNSINGCENDVMETLISHCGKFKTRENGNHMNNLTINWKIAYI